MSDEMEWGVIPKKGGEGEHLASPPRESQSGMPKRKSPEKMRQINTREATIENYTNLKSTKICKAYPTERNPVHQHITVIVLTHG